MHTHTLILYAPQSYIPATVNAVIQGFPKMMQNIVSPQRPVFMGSLKMYLFKTEKPLALQRT
jgi:hypothetical protein